MADERQILTSMRVVQGYGNGRVCDFAYCCVEVVTFIVLLRNDGTFVDAFCI